MRPNGLDGLELIPEPGEPRILTAMDPSAVEHDVAWRSEVMGWAPLNVAPLPRRRRYVTRSGLSALVLVGLLALIVSQGWLLVTLPLPDSEWAFESTGLRSLEERGLDGTGVSVCVVDTGVQMDHPALEGRYITYLDLVAGSSSAVDYGSTAHGTMMVGLLIADGHQQGAAQGVRLGVVAALAEGDDGENTGEERTVAEAIDWCNTEFDADIISLSLGGARVPGSQDLVAGAVRRALDGGVYVVAAAGNDGGSDDDGQVASPAFVPRVIAVGASSQGGEVWNRSSMGGQGVSPNMKPEVIAPGVNVISTGFDGGWFSSSGTSVGTVMVTAALSLILEQHPALMNVDDDRCMQDVKTALAASLGGEHDPLRGYGVLDAVAWEASIDPACADTINED